MRGHDGVGGRVSERGPELVGSKTEAKMGVGVEMSVPRAIDPCSTLLSRPGRPFLDIGVAPWPSVS